MVIIMTANTQFSKISNDTTILAIGLIIASLSDNYVTIVTKNGLQEFEALDVKVEDATREEFDASKKDEPANVKVVNGNSKSARARVIYDANMELAVEARLPRGKLIDKIVKDTAGTEYEISHAYAGSLYQNFHSGK